MPHLGHRATFLYESGLVTTNPPPRADAPPALKGHTRTGGDDRVPTPRPTGISVRPSPARHFTKALCPAESRTPILEKFQEKNQRQRLNRQALVTLAGRGRNLSGGSGPPGCLFQDLSQGREERDPWEIDMVVLLKEELVCSQARRRSKERLGRDQLTEPPPSRSADPRLPLSQTTVAKACLGPAWPPAPPRVARGNR